MEVRRKRQPMNLERKHNKKIYLLDKELEVSVVGFGNLGFRTAFFGGSKAKEKVETYRFKLRNKERLL